ncbi:MAG TPA: SRPBCC family protein [Actinophytocola sp.]|jgi:uncharacterized protein YndB with AHSA1/START domain|uniref:SRPBCC family protein n=1 Tax=Actinophytocola sp. TaxID=1872138 RepID=UPI002F95EEFD
MGWLVITGIVVGVLVLVVLAVMAIGAALPKEHVAARRISLPVEPPEVWAALTDVSAFPAWRPRVERVEVLGTDPLRWREFGRDGKITFEMSETDAPRRLVSRITDDKLPFGGTWTYDIAPSGGGSTVTVTEHGEVRNVLFRFVSRFVMGHTATIDGYLTALGGKFGHPVTPDAAEAR